MNKVVEDFTGRHSSAPDTRPELGSKAPAGGGVGVSVVVPVMNEEENIEVLLGEILAVMRGKEAFEVLFIDDGSTDKTPEILAKAVKSTPELRAIRHKVNCGQSRALRTGILHAAGDIVVTMDGDGQNDPKDVPALIEKLRSSNRPETLGMVSGQRQKRQDSEIKKYASKLGNGIRQWLLSDGTMDTGCSLKAFRRDRFMRLPYFDHMHRYLPALMQREGFQVEFVPVSHRPRLHGSSKYGVLDRLLVSVRDLMGVMWLQKRARLPEEEIEL